MYSQYSKLGRAFLKYLYFSKYKHSSIHGNQHLQHPKYNKKQSGTWKQDEFWPKVTLKKKKKQINKSETTENKIFSKEEIDWYIMWYCISTVI